MNSFAEDRDRALDRDTADRADMNRGAVNVGDPMNSVIRRRRYLSMLSTCGMVLALYFGFGHRGIHALRSMIVPGAGLFEHRHWWLGAAFTMASIAATVCWFRWGMDWLVAFVIGTSMVAAAGLAYIDHPASLALTRIRAAHEFPLVLLVMGALSGLGVIWRKSSVGQWQTARARDSGRLQLSPLEQCTAVSINALARTASSVSNDSPSRVLSTNSNSSINSINSSPSLEVTLDVDKLTQRCRRVGIAARGRFSGDPMRTDHVHVRTALLLTGQLDQCGVESFRADATQAHSAMPSSEPGWLRLLDGTLAACALQQATDHGIGNRWGIALSRSFGLQRGHRPSAVWTPLALRGPRAPGWEHCAATGLARAAGWIDNDDDWLSLRTGALAAAARGNAVVDDERLVAASRIWLVHVEDEQATRIVGRVTIERDPIAVALNALATSLRSDPTLLASTPSTKPSRVL